MTPFLRWAGSKRKLLPILRTYWLGSHSRYVEPFVGSGSFFFDTNPPEALLSDINYELITTFRCVRRYPTKISKILSTFPIEKSFYLHIRAIDPTTLENSERAARFIYLNRFCFNGLYRVNRSGQFNVPYSAQRTGPLPSRRDLLNISKSLQHSKLKCGDFESIIKKLIKKNDFVYLDPPFALSNQRIFSQYDRASFGQNDVTRLFSSVEHIVSSGASFVLSYANYQLPESWLSRWHTRTVSTVRNIAGFSSKRKNCEEIIVSNICPSTRLSEI